MKFDRWFMEQSKLLQIIILFIPFIGWIIELLVRISALIRLHSNKNISGLVIFAIFGGFWVLCIIDAICIAISDHLLLCE